MCYVGPKEKEQFIQFLFKRLRNRKLESVVRSLFRPSYGGNRNFTLMYTLGNCMVSADDDMRPYALVEDSPESLSEDEVSRGKLVQAADGGYTQGPFDILSSFADVLGKKVAEVPKNYDKGELVIDTAMDLETNASKGLARENSLFLKPGRVSRNALVKIAQTFRSGTNDIDATDFVELYLEDEEQTSLDDLNDVYLLVNFRPVITNKNWRMDCGVAGYDNTLGLPRSSRPGCASRTISTTCGFKRRAWSPPTSTPPRPISRTTTCATPSPPRCSTKRWPTCSSARSWRAAASSTTWALNSATRAKSPQDSDQILEKIGAIHRQSVRAARDTKQDGRRLALEMFAYNLEKAFYNFEADFFQQNVSRIVDDVISQIKGSMELWPTLVEICYFQKNRKDLPQTRVKNQKKSSGSGGAAQALPRC